MGKELKESQTHENLRHAFDGESGANRRYLYFARQADIEGYPEVAGHFRDTAEVGRIFMHVSLSEPLPPEDVRCVGQIVA